MKKGVLVAIGAVCEMALSSISCASTGSVGTKKTDDSKKGAVASSGELLEGFEEDGAAEFWRAIGSNWKDGDISTAVATSQEWATEGKNSLVCDFNTAGINGGAATFFTEAPAVIDFSPYKAMTFDVKNPFNVPIQVACAVCTGDTWYWHECKPIDLQPGENRGVRMDFFTGELKTANSNWEFKVNLEDPDDVRRVAFKFFVPANESGSVYIDNIRLQ